MLFRQIFTMASLVAASISCQAQASSGKAAEFINNENEQSRAICVDILNDAKWRAMMGSLGKLSDVYKNYPKNGNDVTFMGIDSLLHNMREDLLYSLQHQNHSSAGGLNIRMGGRNIEEYYYEVRQNRVMKQCGDELIAQRLVLVYPYFSLEPTSEKSLAFSMGLIKKSNACVDAHDRSFASAYEVFASTPSDPEAQRKALNKFSSETLSSTCMLQRESDMKRAIFFPLHKLARNPQGDVDFGSSRYAKSLPTVVDETYARANEKLSGAIAKNKEIKGRQEERENRISMIRAGKLENARSCGDVAEAFLKSEDIVGSLNGYSASKDTQSIHAEPTNKYYASIETINSIERGEIVTHDKNQFGNNSFSSVLKTNSKTVWFGSGLNVGGRVYFVGQYVKNAKTSIRNGSGNFQMPARQYNVICASRM